MSISGLQALRERVARSVDDGPLPAAQYAVARDGELVAFESFGVATDDSRFCIFSASKPVFASLVWTLLGSGDLRLDQRVSDIWPEFAQNGKGLITIEHLLLFTAGIPQPLPRDHLASPEERAGWALAWEPGTRYEYHPTSAHWVLAEVVRRVTEEDHRVALRRRVLDPLGLDRLQLGVPEAEQGDLLRVERVGRDRPELIEALTGQPVDTAFLDAEAEWALALANDPVVVEAGVPGGGIISDAASLALFYQELLHNTHALWDPKILLTATAEVRNRIPDPLRLGAPANRSIGLVIGNRDAPHLKIDELDVDISLSEFGPTASNRTFGHGGFAGQAGWADPDTGLSFTFLTNGADRDGLEEAQRMQTINKFAALIGQ